jgi:hypothetical protein
MEETKNLDQMRDDKCIPLAKSLFKDVADLITPDDANVKIDFNPIVTKFLEKTLAADTNILMENTYVEQLMLSIFSRLNRVAQTCSVVPIDDIRYGRIQKQILQIVAGDVDNLTLGKEEKGEDVEFTSIKEKIDELVVAEKLSMMEVKYIMDNIFTSFDTVTKTFNMSVEIQVKNANAKLFGIDDMMNLSMKKLDETLKQ